MGRAPLFVSESVHVAGSRAPAPAAGGVARALRFPAGPAAASPGAQSPPRARPGSASSRPGRPVAALRSEDARLLMEALDAARAEARVARAEADVFAGSAATGRRAAATAADASSLSLIASLQRQKRWLRGALARAEREVAALRGQGGGVAGGGGDGALAPATRAALEDAREARADAADAATRAREARADAAAARADLRASEQARWGTRGAARTARRDRDSQCVPSARTQRCC